MQFFNTNSVVYMWYTAWSIPSLSEIFVHGKRQICIVENVRIVTTTTAKLPQKNPKNNNNNNKSCGGDAKGLSSRTLHFLATTPELWQVTIDLFILE